MQVLKRYGSRGLSPRVRGNQISNEYETTTIGSIPACAGEPCRSSATPRLRRVYPRVCGGTTMATLVGNMSLGLSPRVRGNL